MKLQNVHVRRKTAELHFYFPTPDYAIINDPLKMPLCFLILFSRFSTYRPSLSLFYMTCGLIPTAEKNSVQRYVLLLYYIILFIYFIIHFLGEVDHVTFNFWYIIAHFLFSFAPIFPSKGTFCLSLHVSSTRHMLG